MHPLRAHNRTNLHVTNSQQIEQAVASHLPKYGVLAVQLLGCCQSDEELAAIGVWRIAVGAGDQASMAEV